MKELRITTFFKNRVRSVKLKSKAIWSFTIGISLILIILAYAGINVFKQNRRVEKMYEQIIVATNYSFENKINFSTMDLEQAELILLSDKNLISTLNIHIKKLGNTFLKNLELIKKKTINKENPKLLQKLSIDFQELEKKRLNLLKKKNYGEYSNIDLLKNWKSLTLKKKIYEDLNKVIKNEKNEGLKTKTISDLEYSFFWKSYLHLIFFMAIINIFFITMFIKNILNPISYLSNFLKKASHSLDDKADLPLEPELAQLTTSINNFLLQVKNNQKEIIKEKNKIEQLIHILCHDIRNPISACISYLWLHKLKPKDPEVVNEFILGFLEHGINIIESVSDMMALSEGKIQIDLQPISVSKAFEESELILKQRLIEKEITLEKINLDGLYILAEESTLINSVINNLLTNSLKFSKKGDKIKIEAVSRPPVIEIRIRDYGIGIPNRLLNIIFEMDEPTTRKGTEGEKGTGFGMPLVKRFMESYEGAIKINTWVITDKKNESDENGKTGTEIVLEFWDGSFSKKMKAS